MISPSGAMGETSVMSGRCVPPEYGSLMANTSPGLGSRFLMASTASGMAPRWTGMCSAWATMRPRESKRAAEQSRRSLMLAEKDERTSTAPISSATARSALPMIWSSISTDRSLFRDDQRARTPVPNPHPPGGDPGGGAVELQHRGAPNLRRLAGLAGREL